MNTRRSTSVNVEYVERLEPWSHASPHAEPSSHAPQHAWVRGVPKPMTMSLQVHTGLAD